MSAVQWNAHPAHRTIASPAGPCVCGGHCMAGEVECVECQREAARLEASHQESNYRREER